MRVVVIFASILALFHENVASISSNDLMPSGYVVRVLIDEKSMEHHEATWQIECCGGFILNEPTNTTQKWKTTRQNLTITYKDTHIILNERVYPSHHLHILPQDGFATINGQPYHGTFSILCYDQRLLLINHVDLEQYVHAVLRTESWPGWPIEVNKVFALVSRSYVMALIHQAQTNPQTHPLPYHVKNTNEHQTYKGMHEVRTIHAAIKQTQGMFLTYDHKPALTMFDSCCGGIIPADIEDFDFEKAPYLARTYACSYCERCWIYTWQKTVSLNTFQKQLQPLLDVAETIDDVMITKHDTSGLVKEVTLYTKQGAKTITGKQFYNAFKEIKSFCFTIEKRPDDVEFCGKGFGHHIGLCQWGAREMVRDGWNYQAILAFYYPGTQIARLQ